MFSSPHDPISLVLLLVTLSLLPFIILMISSFVKIVIVLSLIRNALGVQQSPPNMVINGIAIILTFYIMAPVINKTLDLVSKEEIKITTVKQLPEVFNRIKEPIQGFLIKHSTDQQKHFFIKMAKKLWPEEDSRDIQKDDFLILFPAFIVSEITSAFEIGFLIYLPFVTIDLIISNILLAMGMMMVSPMTISLPFKLMLFVLINGWTKLIEGLVMTYA